MRLSVFVAFALLSSSAFAQPLAGSREAVSTMIHTMRTGTRIFNDGHITKDGLPGYWTDLAAKGLELKMPYLVLSSNSAISHVGVLPDGRLGYDLTVNYKVIGHVDDGALISVKFEYPENTLTTGPFLFKNCNAKDVPTNGLFEPTGYWQITELADLGYSKFLVVEPLPDGEVKLADWEAKLRDEKPEIIEGEKHPFLTKHAARDWKNLDESHFMRGIYIGFRRSEVWIMGADSRITKKRLLSLSASDQQFVRDEFKQGRRDHLIPEYLDDSVGNRGNQRGSVNNRANLRTNAR